MSFVLMVGFGFVCVVVVVCDGWCFCGLRFGKLIGFLVVVLVGVCAIAIELLMWLDGLLCCVCWVL